MASPYALDFSPVANALDGNRKYGLQLQDQEMERQRLLLSKAAAGHAAAAAGREAAMHPLRLKSAQAELAAKQQEAEERRMGRAVDFIHSQSDNFEKLAPEAKAQHWDSLLKSKLFDDDDRKRMFDDPVYGQLWKNPETGYRMLKGLTREHQLRRQKLEADVAKAGVTNLSPGERAVELSTGRTIAEAPPKSPLHAPPAGYEPDPARPGGLRPIAGGPADKITADQAARVALMTEGIKDMPAIREAFGVRLVPDKNAPGGSRVEAMPGEFGVSKAPLGGSLDPVAYAQYYGGLGKVGEGQRAMKSAMEGVLRTLTGAAATKEEVARELEKYMPFPTDTLQTRASKLALFERNLKSIAQMSAHGTSGTDILDMLKSGGAKPNADRAPTAQPNPGAAADTGIAAGSPGSRESPVFVRTEQDAERLPPGVHYRTPPTAGFPNGQIIRR
jgi:hypothetical protein